MLNAAKALNAFFDDEMVISKLEYYYSPTGSYDDQVEYSYNYDKQEWKDSNYNVTTYLPFDGDAVIVSVFIPDVQISKKPGATSGTWGTCNWSISDENILTISAGTGANTNGVSPWEDSADLIAGVVTDGQVVFPEDASALFKNFYHCQSIQLDNADTSNTQKMSYMFWNDYGHSRNPLRTINVSSFNTANVTNMSHMFENLFNLEEVDVSGFDTSKVTDMMFMFSCCTSLSELDVSHFNTANVTEMR